MSRLALARQDLKRMALSAEEQTNWVPRVLGSMMLRPGLGHLGATLGDAAAKYVEFFYAPADTALVELTNGLMTVWIDDEVVVRPAVTSKFNRWNGATFIASPDFESTFVDATDVGYWRDNDEAGGTSAFATGGYLSLTGNGTASAIRDRSVAVVETGTEHSIDIEVARGAAMLRVGTTEGGDELLGDRTLRSGYHSISVTPTTSTMFIRLSASRNTATLIDSVALGQGQADMMLPTPWLEADLGYVRWKQINDVIFVACKGRPQKRIERQGADSPRSWSVVEYAPEDGPFRGLNVGPVRLKGSALTGDITLTAERAYFKSTNVGSLFELTSAGQEVTGTFTSDNVFTDPIRVTGVGDTRTFNISVTGSPFTATTTVTVQRSVAEPGDWTDIHAGYTAPQNTNFTDGLDNQIIYYRIGIKTGEYTAADSITATLTYSVGSITGIVRATGFTSSTVMSAQVLRALGKADQYTQDWREGDWSDRRGYPSAVAEYGGRMFWAGKALVWGSVPDGYDSFDDTIEGDSAPIRRTLGEGGVDTVNWLLAADNLMLGMESVASVARSSSLDEPLTQSQFDLKVAGDMGTAPVPAIRIDTSAIFIGYNENRVYEITKDTSSYAYAPPGDLTAIVPEIGDEGFVRRAYQRYPDRRLHLVRGDGTVAMLVFDKLEQVTCWIEIETDGLIEDVVMLPGAPGAKREDRVYYVVKRTINGVDKRFLEKWATELQGQGVADTRLADCHLTGTLSGSTTVPVAHLEGETVVLWGNGKDLGTYVVSGGQITASEAITGTYCVGLAYTARYKSAKLAVASQMQVPLTQRKQIDTIGLVMADTHAQGLRYGQDFDNLDDLPQVEEGTIVDPNSIWAAYDYDAFTLNGAWSSDARLCLEASSPRPCTVLGVALGVEGHDKA